MNDKWRGRSRIKIRYSTTLYVLMYLLVFFSTTYFNKIYDVIKYIFIVLIALLLIKKYRFNIFRQNRMLNLTVIAFAAVVLLVSWLDRDLSAVRDPFLAAIIFAAILLEFLFTLETAAYEGVMHQFICLYYKLTLVLTILTDVLIFAAPGLQEKYTYYFVGTKFRVVYLHFFLIAFYLTKNLKKLKKKHAAFRTTSCTLLFFVGFTVFISWRVDCASGIVGTILLFIFYFRTGRSNSVLHYPVTFLCVLLGSFSFIWTYRLFIENPYFSDFITDIMGRSLTLTGRVDIYKNIMPVIKKQLLTGYGYGSSYEVCMDHFGYADSQNGLMEWILQVGIAGTIPLLIWMCIAMRQTKVKMKYKNWEPLMALVYVLLLSASIEITLSLDFFGLLLCIYGLKKEIEIRR